MEPNGKPARQRNFDLRPEPKSEPSQDIIPDRPGGPLDIEKEGSQPSGQDREEPGGTPVLQDEDAASEGIDTGEEKSGELSEEDDDNPDQESDEALPEDKKEQAIRHDLAGNGVRYEPE